MQIASEEEIVPTASALDSTSIIFSEEEKVVVVELHDANNLITDVSKTIEPNQEEIVDNIVLVDEKESESNITDGVICINKRTDNAPYSTNPVWEHHDCVAFCAYRLLPNEMDLNGRSFAISVYIKSSDCRFNLGDIVSDKSGSKLMFLGVRFDKKDTTSIKDMLLYFFPVTDNTTEGSFEQSLNKVSFLRDLLLISGDTLINDFPNILTDEGLSYTQPIVEVVKTVMVKLRDILMEQHELSLLEKKLMPATAARGSQDPIAPKVTKDPIAAKVTKEQPSMPKAPKEPTRPPSIRNIGKQHTLQVSSTPINTFKPSDYRPISGSKRTIIEIVDDKSHSSAPNIRKKVTSNSESSYDDEATLMLKTKDQLLNICSRLDIYLPKSSNKSTIIEAILSHKSRNRSTDSRSISNNNTISSSRHTVLPTVQQEKEDYLQNKLYQSNILNDIGKQLNGIETRLNSNLQSTSEKTNNYQSSSSVFHDELVAARATLCALKEHKEEDKKALKDHVEIFGQISEASTKPIMEAMRLFSQTTLAAFEKSANTTSSTSSQQITSPPPIQIILPPTTSTNNMSTSVSSNEQQLLLNSLMSNLSQGVSSSLAQVQQTQPFTLQQSIPLQVPSSNLGNDNNSTGLFNMLQSIQQQQHNNAISNNPYQALLSQSNPLTVLQQLLPNPALINNNQFSSPIGLQSLLQQQALPSSAGSTAIAANNTHHQMLQYLQEQLGRNSGSHQSVTLQQTPVQLGVQPSLLQQSFQSPPASFNDNNLNNQLLQQQLLLQMQQSSATSAIPRSQNPEGSSSTQSALLNQLLLQMLNNKNI